MQCEFRDKRELTKSLCDKIQSVVLPLAEFAEIKTFGYRVFFQDGNSFDISNNFPWTDFCKENFGDVLIPQYEKELLSVLREEQVHFFRSGDPDPQNAFLSALYEKDVWNTLSFYRKSGNVIEGFYFASTRKNPSITEQYLGNLKFFERFSLYFKEKLPDIISLEEMKNEARGITVSPLIFQQQSSLVSKEGKALKDFVSHTPIHKFFLTVEGEEISLSSQEFKCLALLSRGQTAKQIAKTLHISPRTVESYLGTVKNKLKVGSRAQLIRLFRLNFPQDYVFF